MAFREDSKFQLVKGPARYSSQPFLPGESSSSAPGFHLGNNVLDFSSSSAAAATAAPMAKASAKLQKPPPPTASKSQLDRLNYKVRTEEGGTERERERCHSRYVERKRR